MRRFSLATLALELAFVEVQSFLTTDLGFFCFISRVAYLIILANGRNSHVLDFHVIHRSDLR